jgi:hypothetical protein
MVQTFASRWCLGRVNWAVADAFTHYLSTMSDFLLNVDSYGPGRPLTFLKKLQEEAAYELYSIRRTILEMLNGKICKFYSCAPDELTIRS